MKLDFTKQRTLYQRGYETEGNSQITEKKQPEEKTSQTIKPIETEYKGYRFRSRLEARWAVFFDACGVEWEYEPEGFELKNGIRYLPDFLLHDVRTQAGRERCELYVEVKGNMQKSDFSKILSFAYDGFSGNQNLKPVRRIFVVGNMPDGTFDSIIRDYCSCILGIGPFSMQTVSGDESAAIPCIDKNGEFSLHDEKHGDMIDDKKTKLAYCVARQARFEHGDEPTAQQTLADKKKEKLEQIRQHLKEEMPISLVGTAVENYQLIDSFEDGTLHVSDFKALEEFKKMFMDSIVSAPSMRCFLREIAGRGRLDTPVNLPRYKMFERKFNHASWIYSDWGASYMQIVSDFIKLLSTAFEEPKIGDRKAYWDDFLLKYCKGKED